LPTLVSLGAISSFTKGVFHKYFTKVSAVVVILLGALSLVNGFALTGNVIGIDAPPIKDNPLVNLVDGKQVIDMNVNGLDYSPSAFTIVKDIPVEWRIDGTKAQGCAQVISVPNLGITEYLPRDQVKIIEFTAKENGIIRFSCSMGMAGPGTFIVVENKAPNRQAKQETFEDTLANGETQKLAMEISKERGFYPNTFTVKKGVPVELEIDAKFQLSGCMGVMVIPNYDVAHRLTLGKSTLTFTPTKEGKSIFTCSMGTPLGSFLVV
ncbi:cupredoxin domain-containing protein, partial [Candidatus Pacearchaeota archaeon]|nr:cupredoxin domain-containing protein [Candidatus Pacearchaeota archaeon]